VNTDASFETATGSGSGGVVIREEDGKVLEAASKFYVRTQLARVCGYEKVVLEVDNLALVNLLRSATGDQSDIAGLWHEISDLSNSFNSFLVSFVNREGNEAAHFCAKLSSESLRELFWADAFPLELLGIAEADCNPAVGLI
jgi:hypothetical protein